MKPISQGSREIAPVETAWFTPGRFAGMLALLVVCSFPSVLFGLGAFVYGDAAQFSYPLAFHYRECFWHGEIPLWNPLNSCGIPFLAQWNTLTLYPPSLFYLVFPMPWSFGVFCLGHIFLAGMGMYLLARDWTHNGLAAAVAGTAFAFNGLTWQALMWPSILGALAWMPWLVLTTQKAWREGGRSIAPAVLVGAVQMLSGGAEVILLTWVLLGAMAAAQLIRGEIPRAKLIVRAVCVAALVGGLSAVQIFPFLDLLAHSQRTGAYGSGGMAGIESMPLMGAINYFVPLFHCARNPQGIFVQINQGWVASYFLGIGIVAFALFAIWRVRNQRVWLLAALTLFSLLMALGDRGLMYPFLARVVPVFSFIRFPVKFVALATFTIPLLAAFGMNCLNVAPAESWPRDSRKAKVLALGIIALMAAALWWARKYPLPGEEFFTMLGNALLRVVMLALIFGCVMLLRRKIDLKLQRLLQSGIVVLLWFDVFTHTTNLSPTAPASVLKPGAVRQFFNWQNELKPGISRAVQSRDSLWKMTSLGWSDPEEDVTYRRLSLSMNLNLLDEVPKFDGFYPVDLKEHLEIFKRVFFTTNDAPGLKNFLGISRVSNPTNIFDWVPRDSFLPLVTVGQKPVFAGDTDTLGAVFSDSFEPLRTVYLPLEAEKQIRADGRSEARILSTQFAAQHLEIETEAAGSAMVVVAQTFYHPWHAYVDGVRAPLWRANEAFQALEIPAGKHHVRLVYEDTAFFCGAGLSALSLVLCLAVWFWFGRKNSAEQPGEAPF